MLTVQRADCEEHALTEGSTHGSLACEVSVEQRLLDDSQV